MSSVMGEGETALVGRAAEGDRVAIQQLLTRHHDRLVQMVEDKLPADLRGALAAEDVCQEAYILVFQQITALNERNSAIFRSWLQAIVERKLIDAVRMLRAQKRGGGRRAEFGRPEQDASSVIELLDILAVHEHTPSRSIARRELVAGIRAAMDQLKDDHRAALRMHYIDGLTVAETAERMGRSGGAVVMLCNRALRRLADIIGDPSRFRGEGA